jgi:hypothetical protein
LSRPKPPTFVVPIEEEEEEEEYYNVKLFVQNSS